MVNKARAFPSKIRYYFSILLIMLSGGTALFLGAGTVSVNCHNTVSASQIVFFDIDSVDGQTVITFLGKEFHF